MRCAECNVCYVSEKVIYCSFLGKSLSEKHTCTHEQEQEHKIVCEQCKDEEPAKEINGTHESEKIRKKGERNWNREEETTITPAD